MTIKIVLPEGEGSRASWGTKVYTDSGHEIENVTRIQMDILPDSIIEATITVAVSEIENLRGIDGIVIAESEPKEEYVPLETGVKEWGRGVIVYPEDDNI